jgi:hypothetical protein
MDRRAAHRRALPDILVGGIFIAFGAAFALATIIDYDIGTPFQMGPGFFPLVLGALLAVLGAGVVGSGFVTEREELIGSIPWRAVILLTVAFIFFALTVRNLGVVPSLFVTVLLAAFASERIGVVGALAIGVGLTVASVVIFVVLLQLTLPLFGPWLPFLRR